MPRIAAALRDFFVQPADGSAGCVRQVQGAGFEDAAFAFVEDAHLAMGEDELAVIVEDCETGERQCFRVDLAAGAAAACDDASRDEPPATDRSRAVASR